MHKNTISLDQRFWSKVATTEPHECWYWKASIDVNGYGQFGMWKLRPDGKKTWTMAKAHRVAWLLTHGEIPAGMYLCHKCDMPRCVNPSHLFLGTQTDNMRDCVNKNRHGFGRVGQPIYFNIERIKKIIASYQSGMGVADITKRHRISPSHMRKVLKRHKIPLRESNAKLTAVEVRQIRELYAMGNVSQTDLAERFEVSRANISTIVRGENWPNLPISATLTPEQIRRRKKLTQEQVAEIRALWSTGSINQIQIGERFGVHGSTVNQIVHNRIHLNRIADGAVKPN